MLKKLLVILWLSMSVLTSNCMEKNSNYDVEAMEKLDIKIATNDEYAVIPFLAVNPVFVVNNLELIYKKAFVNNLDLVIEYLQGKYKFKLEDLVNWALEVHNIEWVKKLTKFYHFVDGEILKYYHFQDRLKKLNLDITILDEICIYDKKNYVCSGGIKYINYLLTQNVMIDNSNTILRFIRVLPIEEIQDPYSTGRTMLEIAESLFPKNDKGRTPGQLKIINLIKRRLNNSQIPDQSHDEASSSQAPSDPTIIKKNPKMKSGKSKFTKGLAFAGATIVGCVAVYLCYTMFNKSSVKTTVKIK